MATNTVPPVPAPAPNTRPGLSTSALPNALGPLSDLAGTWVGTGFNLISLPDFSSVPPSTGPADFRLKLNATLETLTFTPIGGTVPNRGVVSAPGSITGQPDIAINGLTYLQKVSDAVTKEAMHIEPGFWLNVPETTVAPVAPASVVRLATIPHGDSLLAQGSFLTVPSGPIINPVSSKPALNPPGPPLGLPYLLPFENPPLPPGIPLPFVENPNLLLQEAILGQNIINTVVLIISTAPSGNIVNIPFVVSNANATRMDAIFWIETVQNPDGSTFLQLQYTQTVILNFLGIDWPHISVATLVKQ